MCFQLEEKERKDQEEAEKQRLEELQNKTPEVTITVVNTPGSNAPPAPNQSASGRGNKNGKKQDSGQGSEAGSKVNKNSVSTEPPQMVTIKRVMEANGAEPTVTITLKGATPDKDKVLFTLVNGQGDYRTSFYFILHYINNIKGKPGKVK